MADDNKRPKLEDGFDALEKRDRIHPDRATISLPPELGGDVKNIRRRLDAQKADPAPLVATLASAATSVVATVGLFAKGVEFGWLVLALLVAGGSATAGILRYLAAKKAENNPDLIQAKLDADTLVTWQEEARVKVDRELRAQLLEAERARRVIPPKGGT